MEVFKANWHDSNTIYIVIIPLCFEDHRIFTRYVRYLIT